MILKLHKYFLIIVTILILIGINIPCTASESYTETEYYTVNEPYIEIEQYMVSEPYTETEYYTVSEPYTEQATLSYEQNVIYTTDATYPNIILQDIVVKNTDTVGGSFWIDLSMGGCSTCRTETAYIIPGSSYTFHPGSFQKGGNPLQYEIMVPTKTVTKYHDIQKSRQVTKYRDIQKSRQVTKYRNDTFRIGPTVNLRPVKDDIGKSEDGLIELYIDNPSVNDVVMNADVRISVPSGISVYGQGFGDAGSAGVVHGVFNIAPGKSRTIQMTIKAEMTGEFLIKFGGLYWPGNNKDAFESISLTHSIKVRDISTPKITPTVTKNDKDNPAMDGFGIFIKNILDFLDNIFKS